MHSLTTLLVASLATLALTKPVPQITTKGFSVTGTVAKPLPAYPVRLARVYEKYGKPVPSNIAAAAAAATETGSVPAIPEESDVAYLSEVNIGGQTLTLDFDTGSADLWVFSSELASSYTEGHAIYNPNKSKTAKKLNGATWKIRYGDGSGASGDVYTDDVEVAGITVKGQAVELASKVSSQFLQDPDNDGLLGLAFSSINTVQPKPQTTWFDTAAAQGLFAKSLFTVDLKQGAPGTYDFGYIDSSKYTGKITYTDINESQGFWEFTGTGYGVGDGNFQEQDIDAIADTGTTLLLMDDSIVEDYYSQVDGAEVDQQQGGYVFPCSAQLPDMILGIGSGQATIPGGLMSLGAVSRGSSSCFGGLQSNQGVGLSIYGDIFLKAVLAVFDADNKRFGFAPKSS
ncbi:hypothetical protein LTR05_000631 [Lithohypha guttulata]|uniref:Peptidase A1 domain-containing protein n=1 Tax=Lithohypha guttulata TaxID=1690604 RepID=A0AAN7T4T7_9EURO|nr:hypothetical protein LTR05_000631 [Lithohypha guttulata]